MLLHDVEELVRLDLFDPEGTNQRWSSADIERAIDKAVERYTRYYPNIAYVDMTTQAMQRTYPYPQSWNASYPVLWLERVLYPLQIYGSAFAPPASAVTPVLTAGSILAVGTYRYAVTFISQGGETIVSPITTITTTGGNQSVTLNNIPCGPSTPPGSAASSIIGRNIYRSTVASPTLYLLTTIPDNTTTTWPDTLADAALTNQPQAPIINTSGIMVYPPCECAYAEHSDLFDSTASISAGGNMGAMGSPGTELAPVGQSAKTFTLLLSNSALPPDDSAIMRVFYATRHQLDASGSTIPELHRDIIVLGATAYAMEAYQVPTNDNFDFQDGAVRDRIDDTKIPLAWAAAAHNRMQQFSDCLEEIKRQRDYATSSQAQWGNVPRYWGWL